MNNDSTIWATSPEKSNCPLKIVRYLPCDEQFFNNAYPSALILGGVYTMPVYWLWKSTYSKSLQNLVQMKNHSKYKMAICGTSQDLIVFTSK